MHVRPEDLRTALRRAGSRRARSYSPYSRFRGAAVVIDDDGRFHDGVIVENISLGLTMCAERAALFSTIAQGGSPQAIALVAPRTDGDTTWPCGACLQTALELGGPDLILVAAPPDALDALDELERLDLARLGDLLPLGPRRGDSGRAHSVGASATGPLPR